LQQEQSRTGLARVEWDEGKKRQETAAFYLPEIDDLPQNTKKTLPITQQALHKGISVINLALSNTRCH
jgi:hypothetical protein